MNETLSIGFPLTESLQTRITDFISTFENNDQNKKEVREMLFTLVKDMTDIGLDYFFLESIQFAKVGQISQSTVRVGLSSAKRGIFFVAGKIIRGLNEKQLGKIVQYLHNILLQTNKTIP